jgi:hypothetical protein
LIRGFSGSFFDIPILTLSLQLFWRDALHFFRRDARAVERGGLENRCPASRDRGFESLSLRKRKSIPRLAVGFFIAARLKPRLKPCSNEKDRQREAMEGLIFFCWDLPPCGSRSNPSGSHLPARNDGLECAC